MHHSKFSYNKSNLGFTLIEVLVIVVIIGILATIIVPNIIGRVQEARITKAKNDIHSLEDALNMYHIDAGMFPTTEQGLKALMEKPGNDPIPSMWNGPYIQRLPQDPWGSEYQYANPGKHGALDIYSFGPNSKEEGDANIGNWQLR